MKKDVFKFDTGILQIKKGSIPVMCFYTKNARKNYGKNKV
jgi:hypothetical protein